LPEKLFEYTVEKRNFHDYELEGIDSIILYAVSSSNNIKNNSLLFVKKEDDLKAVLSNRSISSCMIIARKEHFLKLKDRIAVDRNIFVLVDNPRLDYAKVLLKILDGISYHENNLKNLKYDPEKHIFIGKNVEIGTNVIIEPFVTIGSNVKIDENVVVKSGTKILNNVLIGKNCEIDENVVIGSQGFGIEVDNLTTTYRIPHLGGVIIGDNVSIGSGSIINSGTIEPTIIMNNVKIDSSVHIAHNCLIKDSSLIASNSITSGSCEVGRNVWIGPNSVIANRVTIQDNVYVAMGSVVIRNVKKGQKVSGNFAIDHEKHLKHVFESSR